MSRYKFQERHSDPKVERIQTELEDNFISLDSDGNLRLNGDLHVNDIYAAAESLYLGGVKFSSPKIGDGSKAMVVNEKERKIEYEPFTDIISTLIPFIENNLTHDNISGSLPLPTIKVNNYTADFNDVVLCTGTFTVTLPNINLQDIGKSITVMNVGTGKITIQGDGSDTVHDETTQTAYAGESIDMIAVFSTAWRVT